MIRSSVWNENEVHVESGDVKRAGLWFIFISLIRSKLQSRLRLTLRHPHNLCISLMSTFEEARGLPGVEIKSSHDLSWHVVAAWIIETRARFLIRPSNMWSDEWWNIPRERLEQISICISISPLFLSAFILFFLFFPIRNVLNVQFLVRWVIVNRDFFFNLQEYYISMF